MLCSFICTFVCNSKLLQSIFWISPLFHQYLTFSLTEDMNIFLEKTQTIRLITDAQGEVLYGRLRR
jgi:hypothetical protein